ncbi:single-stranded DNA-binding protein [Kocuria sabuli]|uniref:single-stranded DNA-binding protein n=1 Tax=Kocuria sabuli TaxID=3071448 RepID=UPI0034D44416
MTDQITVRGYVATDPESRNLPDGTVVVTFRLASTPRWFDQQSSSWRDGHTNWLTVQAFRALGLNALASIKKGQPVVVVGKLKVRFWEGEHGRNTAVDVDAVSIGHDLALGTACFQRTITTSPTAEQAGHEASSGDGTAPPVPGDATAAPDELGEPEEDGPPLPEDVDPETGEIRTGGTAPGRRPRRQPASA